jgi:hypothetical protein
VVAVTSGTTVADWVKNPATFYTTPTKNIGDHSGLGTSNDNLWNPATKTVFDPCPAGWIVALSFDNVNPNRELYTWFHGYTIPGFGEYYPATGIRLYTNSNLSSKDAIYIWLARIDDIYGYNFSTDEFNDLDSEEQDRSFGIPVRCVKQ